MRIRETKEEERGISLGERAIICCSVNELGADDFRNECNNWVESRGYVPHSQSKFRAKFRVTEEREMTPDEENAWYLIEAIKRNYKSPKEALGGNLGNKLFNAEQLMEGKEVV